MTRQQIFDKYPDEEFLFADGYDECIIGITSTDLRVVYDTEMCIQVLIKQGMSRGEAVEYFYFNTVGAYVGDKTPIYCEREL
jgi:hypothetical protein